MTRDEAGSAITRPQFFKIIGIMSGVLAGMVTLHGAIILPVVRQAVAADIKEAVDHHSERPHIGAVSRREFESLQKSQLRIEDKIDRLIELRK